MARLLPVLILVACVSSRPAAVDQEADVKRASDQFSATRISGDAAAFARQFTDDGIYMVPGVADAAGQTAIEKLAKRQLAPGRLTDFEVHRREIIVDGDTAHELASYSETNRGGEQPMRMDGR